MPEQDRFPENKIYRGLAFTIVTTRLPKTRNLLTNKHIPIPLSANWVHGVYITIK